MAAAITTDSTTVKRSWADIVKGEVTTPSKVQEVAEDELDMCANVVEPATRGTYLCHRLGEVLVMLGHYGWILPFDEIDHPDAMKTGGRVYVHKRDIKSDVKLAKGDVVSFYLYADDQGFGAEYCQLEQRVSDLRVDAEEFVPAGGLTPAWNPDATEFVPTSGFASSFNPDAPEFKPSALENTSNYAIDIASAMILSKPDVIAINPAFLSDDESDDASSFNDADVSSNGDKESLCDESDLSSEHDVDTEVDSDDDIAVVHVPLIAKGLASDGSTSVGVTSDSELEDAPTFIRPPPGLESLLSFRPPPGLAL